MTSRELLTLLEGLPEKSRYKGALRALPYGLEYEWGPEEYRAAALVRQLAPLNDAGDMTIPRPLYESYFSPVERMKIEAVQAAEAENHSGAKSAIHKGLYAQVPERR